MPVDPTGADLKRYQAEDTGGPVVMLNLLKFADGGAETYGAYVRATGPHLKAIGGRVLYAGDLTTSVVQRDDFDWDAVLVVEYPSRAAFLEMVANPDYHQVSKIRTEALSEAVLQASTPWF